VTGAARHAAGEHGVGLRVSQESRSPGVTFSQALTGRVAAALGGAPALATAAGHDAGILAARVPAAMIFVRNPTGASHCPAERAGEQDCLAGVRGLAAVLADLAAR
jgi:N-carbamoyl-L-amino-acid hydrolase